MKLLGIAEIAIELGERRQTVAQWYFRGKLPEPDQVLRMGPVWSGRAIAPFLKRVRSDRRQLEIKTSGQ